MGHYKNTMKTQSPQLTAKPSRTHFCLFATQHKYSFQYFTTNYPTSNFYLFFFLKKRDLTWKHHCQVPTKNLLTNPSNGAPSVSTPVCDFVCSHLTVHTPLFDLFHSMFFSFFWGRVMALVVTPLQVVKMCPNCLKIRNDFKWCSQTIQRITHMDMFCYISNIIFSNVCTTSVSTSCQMNKLCYQFKYQKVFSTT